MSKTELPQLGVNRIVMQRVATSFRNGERLTLDLECGHTMDAVNQADEVPCFECSSEISRLLDRSNRIRLTA